MENNFSDVDRVLGTPIANRPSLSLQDSSTSKTDKYRPTIRPPMAILQIFDDGKNSSENIRIRQDVTSIGRKECNVSIPHDNYIEANHLVIRRSQMNGSWMWSVEDISKIGLFVRVRRARLRHGSEFHAGAQRIIFHSAAAIADDVKSQLSARLDRGSIPGESAHSDGVNCASLAVCKGVEIGPKLWLLGNEYWIGRSEECAICIASDRFLAPKHVLIRRQSNGEWHAQTEKAPNGLWIRVAAIKIKNSCTFQIGEQRFRLTVC